VHVITKSQTGAEGIREDDGVIVHEIAEPTMAVPPQLHYLEIPLWSLMAATKYAQLDQAVGFDIVEAPDYRGEALHLQPRPETALIVWLHSTMMVVWNSTPGYERTPTDDAWHALEMAALERADLLLAPSQLLLDTTSGFLGDRMRPVELMPYLFDADQFPAKRVARDAGPLQVLFYGHIEPRKNPEVALHTVAELQRRGIDAELTVLGKNVDFHTERVLQPLASELGLSGVRYVPHTDIDGLRATLAGADVAILASRFDNSPLTVFESLSSGVPVITSDKVGTASWIEPENGLLTLPIDDPAEFGRRAADAIDSDWISTGDRAAARMREMFSPAVVTERLLDCYARLMATRERTAPAAGRIEGARGTAVLAFAGELIADPSLLRSWGESFSDSDDVTLVIHAPGWSEDEVAAKVGAAVAEAGLDGDTAPDLLAWTQPLSGGADAVLSRNDPPAPFADLPRVDEDSVPKLSVLLGERAAA
jgi:glycosyltransferase involved in cell wall biosynthesis